jgi:hypothetical protein
VSRVGRLAEAFFFRVAQDQFHVRMKDVEGLLAIHREVCDSSFTPLPRASALNRSVVVIAVSAWQAYVEGVTTHHLRQMKAWGDVDDGRVYRSMSASRDALLELGHEQVRRFSSPNAEQSMRLLRLVGIDAKSAWNFRVGRRHVGFSEARAELNEWVKVRHHIAHAAAELPPVGVLGPKASLTRTRAERCARFLTALVDATSGGFVVEGSPLRAGPYR